MSVSAGHKQEMKFMCSDEELCNIPDEFKGTNQLCKKLQKIQVNRMLECIPETERKIAEHYKKYMGQLQKFSNPCDSKMEAVKGLQTKAMKLHMVLFCFCFFLFQFSEIFLLPYDPYFLFFSSSR